MVRTLAGLAGVEPNALVMLASQGLGLVAAAILGGSGLYAESRFKATQRAVEDVKAAKLAAAQAAQGDGRTQIRGGRALKDRVARSTAAEVTDRESGITFQVAPDATLLEAITTAGLKINYGCRAGVCGADPVVICEGGEHLSPPGDDELATLRRLGLEGRARLACMCSVKGPVRIDRDPRSAPAPTSHSVILLPKVDKASRAGISRVVIVGNGVAGMSAAEALRRDSASVQIDIVTNEAFHFYNRMGIGRLIHDSAGMAGLQLVADDWPETNRVTVWRNTVATAIDRSAKRLSLASGETLAYDKLILATGARSATPDAEFMNHANAFVLRNADDAQAIRDHVQQHRCRRAVVIGGGVLGVEAADSLRKLGLQVMLLQRADRLMNAQLDEAGAAKLTAYLESLGIQVVPNVSVTKFDGADHLTAAWLSHGPRVRADLFVACLGIQANVFLAERAGLAVGSAGIVVDDTLRSTDPDIYAIGDAAELRGSPRGLWTIGAAHAATAVAAILGEPVAAKLPRIVLQLKCDGIDLRSHGEINPREGDEEFHARADDPAWWRLILRQGQLVGGVYVGPPGSAKLMTKLLLQPPDLEDWRDELRAGNLEALKSALH
jgi:NADPH-dependent 2,4-dienoyl-CoA reductase/sulfur reductase-like enzyme/ferredoxin